MRLPATHFAGNLMWTRQGTVYASWALTALPSGRSDDDLQLVADAHSAFYRALAGREVLLRGTLVWTDPVAVVARMIDGLDLTGLDGWAEECEQTIDAVADLPLGSRLWTLTVPLGVSDWKQKARTLVRSATTDLCDQLRIPGMRPADAEIDYYRQSAATLAGSWPSPFAHRPVTVAEQLWLLRYAQSRGAEALANPFDVPTVATDQLTGRAGVGEPLLDPAGMTDVDDPKKIRASAPLRRRWLKTVTDTGTTSYQAGLVLADVPAGGMETPGGEFLGRLDELGVPADIGIRMTVRTRAEGLRRNKRGFTMLNDQADQIDGSPDVASLSTGLQEAARQLIDYHQRLSINTKEVEIEPVVMVSVAAATSDAADQLALDFVQAPGNKEFTWARPVGAEEDIFWAMQPGGRLSMQLNDYRHITTGADFAAAAPMMTSRLGARTGSLLGLNTTTPLLSTFHLDLAGEAERNFSPSIALVGELGSGKSFSEKKICGDEIDRGAVGIAIDGSVTREWATFARSLDGKRVSIADVQQPEVSLDPLRVLPAHRAGAVLQSFLVKLCDFSATSAEGITLAKVLKPTYLQAHTITSSAQLLTHLGTDCEYGNASAIADKIAVFADPDTAGALADIVFTEDLPPLDLTASDMTVFGTHGVKLPTQAELESAHLYNRLGVEKLFGQAFYLLIARYAHEVCFSDPSRPAVFAVDETWRVTLSEEGAAIVLEFIRDGRKVKAIILLGSHDPEVDFGGETLSGLIGTKIVMRHRNRRLAEKSVAWLGFDPGVRVDLVEKVQSLSPQDKNGVVPPERRGESIVVDPMSQFGDLKILPPARTKRAEAISSTPPSRAVV